MGYFNFTKIYLETEIKWLYDDYFVAATKRKCLNMPRTNYYSTMTTRFHELKILLHWRNELNSLDRIVSMELYKNWKRILCFFSIELGHKIRSRSPKCPGTFRIVLFRIWFIFWLLQRQSAKSFSNNSEQIHLKEFILPHFDLKMNF